MNGLIASELRRAWSRRIIRLFAALALLGIVIAAFSVAAKSDPPSASIEAELARYEARIQQCIDGEITIPGEFGGGEIPAQSREDFCRYSGFIRPPTHETFRYASMKGVLLGTSVPLIIVAFLLGASLIGAEWRAGTITTTLTWEPDRIRLFVTKLAVAVVACIAFMLAVQLTLMLIMLPVAALRGTTAGLDAAFWRTTAGVLGRGGLMVGVAAALGFSIGATGRNTAAALGVGFVYIAVIEGFLTNLLPWFRPWSLVGNAVIWVGGESSREVAGRSVGGAGLLLAIYAAGVAAVATSIFRTRDVT